jgi:WD40 repeat protein
VEVRRKAIHPFEKQYHKTLARYFMSKPLFFDDVNKGKPHVRKCVEQPWQQTKAEMWDETADTLCDLLFVEAKVRAGMVFELQEDYEFVLAGLPEAQEEKKNESQRQERLKNYTRNLIEYTKAFNRYQNSKSKEPNVTFPVLEFAEPWSDEQIDKKFERIKNNPSKYDIIKLFLNYIIKNKYRLSEFHYFSGYPIQHIYNNNDSGPLATQAENIIKKINFPLMLNPKKYRKSFNPFGICMSTLKGHKERITCLNITPDGLMLLSGSTDGIIKLWDTRTFNCLLTIKGDEFIEYADITPDGNFGIIFAGTDKLKFWDFTTGECLQSIKTEYLDSISTNIKRVRICIDKSYAVLFNNNYNLELWDLGTGKLVNVYDKYGPFLDITPDFRYAIQIIENENKEHYFRLFDIKKEAFIKTSKKIGCFKNVKLTSNCRYAFFEAEINESDWLYDILGVWNIKEDTLSEIKKENIHSYARIISVTPDGKFILTRDNNTLNLLDTRSGVIKKEIFLDDCYTGQYQLSDDARILATTGFRDYDINIWNVYNGQYISRKEELHGYICNNKYMVTKNDKKDMLNILTELAKKY